MAKVSAPKRTGARAPNFNQAPKGKMPSGKGGFVPGMRGGPKSSLKQKNFSK